ncbi:MAG: TldD/PmbA family protein [Lachnospiraceae bacterium]|nr:TldD/PmbA family protein [Lachnospiraceae bacterium]
MYKFPDGLFTEVRIERTENNYYYVKNGEVEGNGRAAVVGARIRVYDGNMWYTSATNDLDAVQAEIDNLATLAVPNKEIYDDPVIKNFGDARVDRIKYNGENDIRRVTNEQRDALIDGYIASCIDRSIGEMKTYYAGYSSNYKSKEYYSSKGAAIRQDMQRCNMNIGFDFVVDGVTTNAGKFYQELSFDALKNREQEIIAERDRYLDYARNAVDVTAGDYTCVLAPLVTAMFTHESFGHKSESDFMLNDKTLQEEWVLGKTVGNEKVSICDSGDMENNGYTPFDDEGNPAKETWLIKNGVLTGRLHDAKSASVLGEEITGNARAEGYYCSPMVRMTNTYMVKGTDSPEDIIGGVEDGIYVYGVNYGTGSATFTMQPNLCYRIRGGKLCEPVRANVITGSVFKTLFDIDAVGNDFILYNTYTCGKGGQSVPVSAGGPTVRVKKLSVN